MQKKNGWLRKKLSPTPLDTVKAGASAVMLVFVFPALCVYLGVWGMHSGRLPGGRAVVLFAGGVLFLVLGIASLPQMLGNAKRRNRKRAEQLEKLSKAELADLEKEMETAECRFGTFYLLEDYLCIPQAGLLLPYRKLKYIRAIHNYGRHGRRHQACVVETDSFIWVVKVRKWSRFLKEYEDFCAELERRKNQALLRMVTNI